VARSVSGIELPRLTPSDLLAFPVGPEAESPLSSVMVFQSPHPSHRPDHLVELAPHAEQVNVVVAFAMALMCLSDSVTSKPY
jgi:hypothetical protein